MTHREKTRLYTDYRLKHGHLKILAKLKAGIYTGFGAGSGALRGTLRRKGLIHEPTDQGGYPIFAVGCENTKITATGLSALQ